jgi:Bacteriophage Sf6, terminase small subunit-like
MTKKTRKTRKTTPTKSAMKKSVTKKSVIEQSRDRRDAIVKQAADHKTELLDEKQRSTILTLLTEGATLAEIFTIRGITSYSSFYATRNAEPEFDAAVRGAMAQGAEAAIAEAAEVSKSATNSSDPDLMRIAEAFHRCAVGYAEKVAPREFGQLVKLGGIDGGALQVHVVSYAAPALEGQFRQAIDAPKTPAIEAKVGELARV